MACLPERKGPQTYFSLGVVSRSIRVCYLAIFTRNFGNSTLSASRIKGENWRAFLIVCCQRTCTWWSAHARSSNPFLRTSAALRSRERSSLRWARTSSGKRFKLCRGPFQEGFSLCRPLGKYPQPEGSTPGAATQSCTVVEFLTSIKFIGTHSVVLFRLRFLSE